MEGVALSSTPVKNDAIASSSLQGAVAKTAVHHVYCWIYVFAVVVESGRTGLRGRGRGRGRPRLGRRRLVPGKERPVHSRKSGEERQDLGYVHDSLPLHRVAHETLPLAMMVLLALH